MTSAGAQPLTWVLARVISGGQTGVDQAALRAARALGYATGGEVPKGYRTELGPAAWLGTDYGCIESVSGDYQVRTWSNVRDSDATLWIGSLESAGGVVTARAWRARKRPHCSVWPLDEPESKEWTESVETVRAWILGRQLRTLNVAGHRESHMPGIGLKAYLFLLEALAP